MVSVIERAPSMREPAHDQAVLPDHLLAIDAEVLPRLGRAARHGEAPRDERTSVLRPARLHRQAAEIDVFVFDDDLLAGCIRNGLWRQVEELLPDRKLVPQVAQAFRGLWLAQKGEHFS